MEPVEGVCRVLCTFLSITLVSSSHIVFTSSSPVIKPLVTDVLTLRCHLRDGDTTAVIGKRHTVPEFNNQSQDKSDVNTGGQVVSDAIPAVRSHDAQSSEVSFVHSVIIKKDVADIAAVTDHMAASALDKTTDIKVTGHIPGSDAEKAFLEITWKYPGPDQSGNYQCTVSGTDRLGHLKTFKQSVVVSDDDVSMNDVIGYIHQLKRTNDLQAASIESLKHSNAIQKSTITNQSLAIAGMQKEITELQQKQNTTVIFSAYLDNWATVSRGEQVVFNKVLTNVGNSYNPATGVFTCHVSGYYVFDVHIMGQEDKYVGVAIYLNGNVIGYAYVDDQFGFQSASGYVNVVLKQGDKVVVKSFKTSDMMGGSDKQITFSGHLVNLL